MLSARVVRYQPTRSPNVSHTDFAWKTNAFFMRTSRKMVTCVISVYYISVLCVGFWDEVGKQLDAFEVNESRSGCALANLRLDTSIKSRTTSGCFSISPLFLAEFFSLSTLNTESLNRLEIQEFPSTNTVAVMVKDGTIRDSNSAREEIFRVCHVASGGAECDIHAVVTDQFDSSRLVRVTFFDARKALRCMQSLQADQRFSAVLDFRGGTNRSVLVPRLEGYSMDVLVEQFSQFGEIEKIWLTKKDAFVIDFFDSRAPTRVVSHIHSRGVVT